jgi:hypothetical protein
MPITPLPIANGTYLSDSLPLSAQQCINLYPNIPQVASLGQETLFGTPGATLLASSGAVGANRGGWTLNEIPYFVNGNVLYRLNLVVVDAVESFTLSALGAIEGSGRVCMAENGSQLIILNPGGAGYIFTTGPDSLVTITDADFDASGNPLTVVFIDGYFLLTTDTKKFIISSLNDGTSYNALDFGSAESSPDKISGAVVHNNQLFVVGASTTEAFQNIGGADFPFQRSGLFLDKGTSAPFSIVSTNGTFMFIGGSARQSPAIWAFDSNSMTKISTTAIDSFLSKRTASEISTSYSWSYAQKGGYFIGFTVAGTSFVFDSTTSRWHERQSTINTPSNPAKVVAYRHKSFVGAYGRVIVADANDGRIGLLSPEVYDEYGSNIVRTVTTQPFQNNMKPFFVPMIELTIESGVGDAVTPDPEVRMSISSDGKSWTSERSRSMGKIGEYGKTAVWRRNGRMPRFCVFRFVISDKVKVVIIQLTADIT